jgi:hypothetical protein
MTDGQPASLSWCQAHIWDPLTNFSLLFLIIFRQLRVCWCGAPSLTRSPVCSFQFLLGIASAAFLRSESHGTHEHILLPLFFRLPHLEGQVPVFISLKNRVAQLCSPSSKFYSSICIISFACFSQFLNYCLIYLLLCWFHILLV